jgi:DNA-binding FrmR family transcriptional regulator
MHEPSFMQGLELGKFLTRLARVEGRVDEVEKKLESFTARLRRVAILSALWALAVVANLSQDKVAEVTVEIIANALRR